ncbi:hypothetical protein LCGC14_1306840 [marine sediment metagenome]|uniref:Uncharacterized protein n=1 Tax=marine sediment metagenome TaxID=412755 RepID=A0A0F9NQY0_9ZZZZ
MNCKMINDCPQINSLRTRALPDFMFTQGVQETCAKCDHPVNTKIARVREIQVGGGTIVHDLAEAADELYHGLQEEEENQEAFPYPCKIRFTIQLPSGEIKSITIHQNGNDLVAYGDFEGLCNAFEYAKEVEGV